MFHSVVLIRKIRMKFFAIFAAVLLTVANASTDKEQWVAFKQTHGKTYKSLVEEKTRYAIFQSNLNKIAEHNAKYDNGEESYFLGVTKFADMTPEEFSAMLNLQVATKPELNATRHVFPKNLEAPESIDWTANGAVLDVKNQGSCGSCWAFSATGSLEGQNAILNGRKDPLSEQQLLDCSGSYGNGNCQEGGDMVAAFKYVQDNGIATEGDYAYEGQQGSCRYASNPTLRISGYRALGKSENDLEQAVGTIGPISIAINADLLQLYQGGIFNPLICLPNINHGVLAVGYGNGYWKVKNSWGGSWGEGGYFRISKGSNKCGIALDSSYPLL
ncbi:hypothetical protein JTB14_021405 [Gonioctena quinquepunctata]|nr:hypothetical protein JTB14_021405 [Gonioctena quinquepunctata]